MAVPYWERKARKILYYAQREAKDRAQWIASLEPPKKTDFLGLG